MKPKAVPPALRTAVFLLSALMVSLAFWSCVMTLDNWDDLWSAGDYYSSNTIRSPMLRYRYMVEELMNLEMKKQWYGSLSYTEQEQLKALYESLQPENTNFRYQVHHQETSELLSSNMKGAALNTVAAHERSVSSVIDGLYYSDYDYQSYDGERDVFDLWVFPREGGSVLISESGPMDAYNEYGWHFDGYSWDYDQSFDNRVHILPYAIDCGVVKPLAVDDEFSDSLEEYRSIQQFLPYLALTALVTIVLSLTLLSFLCRAAGRRTECPAEISLTWWDRMPLDLYFFFYLFALSLLLAAGDPITVSLSGKTRLTAVVGLTLLTLLTVSLTQALLLSLAVRYKAHTLLRNTCVYRLCAAVARGLRGIFGAWPLTRRVVVLFLLYLSGTVLTGVTVVLIPVYQLFVLWHLCRWLRQWQAIRVCTERIVGGFPDEKIDTKNMYRDLREHAEQLNDLGESISNAVEERLKSERFKAELITNVSHDLKTPLTSIINYVDLLKKTDIQDPKALEYVEVLDRKSQRLKKLTEDLVEASKASTGALTVVKDKLGVTELLDQALGEYGEKFANTRLEPVLTTPDHELYVEADGRHLWRVIDNLLGNCVKYAMPGTRVYLDVKSWDGAVTLSIKNISREPLNIPAEALMERFVRGDASRTTEGSGLGLSIARSLTELQGGTFRIDIDGDLFKAVVVFPEYRGTLPPNGGEAGEGRL